MVKTWFLWKIKATLKQWWYDDPKETGLYNISVLCIPVVPHKAVAEVSE